MNESTTTLGTNYHKSIGIWLLVCCLAIYGMVVLGGVTRLTGSGLSMVEWRPIIGILPPINDEHWNEVYDLYRRTPEFQKINYQMDVNGFKNIFWFEYAHRVLGRMIGVIFLLPLLYFIARRRIEKALIPKLAGMFVLGGLQGLMGWYMVKSGLVHNPHVSQYRLTAHLGLALIIYAWVFWTALDLLVPLKRISQELAGSFKWLVWIVTWSVLLTVLSGGFVAGLKAGYAYNTFPLMAGHLIPEGMFTLSPTWSNFFDNVTTVQFDHRLLATLLFFIIPLLWIMGRKTVLSRNTRIGLHLLVLALFLQIALGIATLLLVVPVALAATHQAGALALFTVTLFVAHQMRGAYTEHG